MRRRPLVVIIDQKLEELSRMQLEICEKQRDLALLADAFIAVKREINHSNNVRSVPKIRKNLKFIAVTTKKYGIIFFEDLSGYEKENVTMFWESGKVDQIP